MASARLVTAVVSGQRPPLIFGAIANARAQLNQLVRSNQVADRRTLVTLTAMNSVASPNNIDLFV